MNKIILFALIVALISGCKAKEQRIGEYACDAQQFASLAKEVALCRDSGFYRNHCYSSLRPANCTKITEALDND